MSRCLLLLFVACQGAPRDLKRPNALALAPDGTLYVSDFHHQRVVRLDGSGRLVETFGHQGLGRGEFWQVWGLQAEGPDRVLVLNERVESAGDGTQVWELKAFERGSETSSWRLRTGDGSELGLAEAFAPWEDGWLVADSSFDALLRYDGALRWQERVTGPGGGAPFAQPSFLRRSGDDLWVIEQFQHRVRRLGPGLEEVAVMGSEGRGEGQLLFPRALAVCPDRWVAVADLGNYRVVRFDLQGSFLDAFEPAPAADDAPVQLMAIEVDAGCQRLFLVDSKGNRVLVTTPGGEPVAEIARW